MPLTFIRTLRLKVRAESYAWLNAAAIEVNQVWNWANATSADAADRNRRAHAKFSSGFALNNLSAGATEYLEHIGADTIQRVNCEYATKRRAAKRVKLRWRVSTGARRSLGWVPFKAASLKRKGNAVRFCGKTFWVFDRAYLGEQQFKDGCFAQGAVGVDWGLKAIATTSEGERLAAGRWRYTYATKLAQAQRRGHKRQAKRIHRKVARCRRDALVKFSTRIVNQYQHVVVGDVSSPKLVKTRMAKAVLDAGWGRLRTLLAYQSQQTAREFQIVNERFTSRACSGCGAFTGPTGQEGLCVREWACQACAATQDRDVNAAKNMLAGRCPRPLSGNEPSAQAGTSRRRPHPRKRRQSTLGVAA